MTTFAKNRLGILTVGIVIFVAGVIFCGITSGRSGEITVGIGFGLIAVALNDLLNCPAVADAADKGAESDENYCPTHGLTSDCPLCHEERLKTQAGRGDLH